VLYLGCFVQRNNNGNRYTPTGLMTNEFSNTSSLSQEQSASSVILAPYRAGPITA